VILGGSIALAIGASGCSSCNSPTTVAPQTESSGATASAGASATASAHATGDSAAAPPGSATAAGDDPCAGEGCDVRGLCAFHKPTNSCMATPLNCKRSSGCRDEGHCSIKKQVDKTPPIVCIASSDGECKQSQACKNDGRCRLQDDKCVK
jgi:hypothetical protein